MRRGHGGSSDPVRCPGLTLPGWQGHPVESGRDARDRTGGSPCCANDRQGVFRVPHACSPVRGLRRRGFRVLSAFSMDDQNDLPDRLVDIDDDLVDQRAHQLLAAAHGDVGVLPCRLEILGDASQIPVSPASERSSLPGQGAPRSRGRGVGPSPQFFSSVAAISRLSGSQAA